MTERPTTRGQSLQGKAAEASFKSYEKSAENNFKKFLKESEKTSKKFKNAKTDKTNEGAKEDKKNRDRAVARDKVLRDKAAGEDYSNIKLYGDAAMRGKGFATPRYMNGGSVMPGRGVRDTKMG